MKKVLFSIGLLSLVAAGCNNQVPSQINSQTQTSSNTQQSGNGTSPSGQTQTVQNAGGQDYQPANQAPASPQIPVLANSLSDEDVLLKGLNTEAQKFFTKSIQIRQGYDESNPYKHFQRDRDRDGKIDVMDSEGYLHLNPSGYGSNLVFVYRYIKDCATKTTIERQVITSDSYDNYTGGDRYDEQCDGTPGQTYYLESTSKLE